MTKRMTQTVVPAILASLILIGCVHQSPNSTPVKTSPLMRNAVEEAAWQIDTLLNNGPTEMGFWGVKVMFAQSGDVIYERNSHKMFMPASNQKLYTTAAALALLGPDYRYSTTFYTNGTLSPDGVLNGDLIIRGSGDPTWSWRFFNDNYDSLYNAFSDTLRSLGITAIEGDIIGDDNVFDDRPYGYSWSWDDQTYIMRRNCQDSRTMRITSTSRSSQIPFPEIRNTRGYQTPAYLEVRNDLVSVDSDTATDWDSGRERAVNRGWFEGEYRISEGEDDEAITIENPTLFTVHVLKEYLDRNGLTVSGNPVDADDLEDSLDYVSLDSIWTYQSHPMSDIIAKVNKPSQNFIAETLQKTLGVEFGEGGSSYHGRQVQYALYDSLGMDTRNLKLRDGSGLSRHNLVSPNTTSSLLKMMWDHEYRTYYMESLPLGGASGTLGKRMKGLSAELNVSAKTGYVGYVRALSGYTWTCSGEPIIFSLMVNHYTIPTYIVNHVQDRICSILSEMP